MISISISQIDAEKKMENYGSDIMAESPRPRAFRVLNRASVSSLTSHDSGGRGRRRKQNGTLINSWKWRRISHFRTASSSGLLLNDSRASPPTSCQSMPIIRNQRTLDRSSNKNEEWDASSSMTRDSCKMLRSCDHQPKPSVKCTSRTRTTKRNNVSFAETQARIFYDISASDNVNLWYERLDHEQFLNDALVCAGNTRRVMKYAAMNENTYKSSIGLTSPQVLKEYLSCPQDIVGIEHLLTGQCTARSSLRRCYRKDLLEEQCSQKNGRRDPHLLAQRLRNNSRISSHMAQERAAYSALLD